MTNGLLQIANRLAEQRRRRNEQIRGALEDAQAAARAFGGAHAPGDRVFDTVSGQEGEVVGRTIENIILPTAKR